MIQWQKNAEGIGSGWLDTPLNTLGKHQAVKAGGVLRQMNIDTIYCSDLERTQETLQLCQLSAPVEFTKRLRERHLGEFEGAVVGTLSALKKSLSVEKFVSFVPKGGESILQFQFRVYNALQWCRSRHQNDTILWVTHGGVITHALLYLLQKDSSQYDLFHPSNCAISIINWDEKKAEMLNSVEHLQ
jgi:broad specificity phosphatase PhoE